MTSLELRQKKSRKRHSISISLCKNGCKADRLVKGYCTRCYQKVYESKKKLLSTTRAPKNKMTQAQMKARAMKFKYKPHDIQKWSYEKIIRLWDRIELSK